MKNIFFQELKDVLRKLRAVYRAAPIRAWLCAAAFIVSFGYALFYQITPSVDARKFHEIAVNLVTKGSFCFECTVPLAKDTAIRDIGPGYQFFLAGVYWIFGIRIWIVWLLQALMHAILVWWLYSLIRRVLGDVRSTHLNTTLPLALYAFHPDIIQSTAMLMTETLFIFLLVALVNMFVRIWERRANVSSWWYIAMGVLSGILMMVRPTGLPFLIAVLVAFVWKRWWRVGIIVLACAILVQVPWAVRNMRVYDRFVLNSVVGGLDMWVGLDPYSPGEFNMDALPHITQKIAGLDPDELDRVSLAEVKRIITERPLFAIGRTVQKGLKLFALTKTSGFWFHYHSKIDQMATVILSVVFNFLLLGMSFAALWDSILRRKLRHWILGLCILAVILLAAAPTLTVVVNRYRIPMLPFMAILSAGWLAFVKGRERGNSLIAAGAMMALTTGADVVGSWDKIRERVLRFK